MSKQFLAPAPDRRYWIVLSLLGVLVAVGLYCYLQQLRYGLGVSGLGRDVAWGLYIGQFAFAEGFAAAALIVLLPLYLHRAEALAPLALPAVIVTIAAVMVCILFILVDLGQPARVFNVLLHPTPSSMMFWDMVSLGGYLAINVVIAATLLEARRSGNPVPACLRSLVLLSLVWGVAVHTVSAFLLGGLVARPLWFTTILAPRFLAAACATSAALLLLLYPLLRRLTPLAAGAEVPRQLAMVMAYGLGCSLFALLIEAFVVGYGGVPEQVEALIALYAVSGEHAMAPLMWLATALLAAAFAVVVTPGLRRFEGAPSVAAALTLLAIGLDKGYGLVVGGFRPSPLGDFPTYAPTLAEVWIAIGIWSIGALIVAVCWRAALDSGADD